MRRSLQFLGFLSDGDLRWLLSAGQIEDLHAGATLVSAGQMLDSLFILVEGRLALSPSEDEGRAKHLVAGEVVGNISAKPAASNVTAELPSRVLRVRRADLVDKCDADEGFAGRFERVMQTLVSQRMQKVLADEDAKNDVAPDKSNTDSVELDAETLDQIYLAARRFDWMRTSG